MSSNNTSIISEVERNMLGLIIVMIFLALIIKTFYENVFSDLA